MSANWTSFKLGLFALAGLATVVVVALALGVRGLHEDTVPYHTYFDETVTGLEVGAPVQYRGVAVGTVGKVTIAPDGRFVDVRLDVRKEQSGRLVWRPESDNGLRTELESQGLTGVKLVNVDLFDPTTHPPPPLPEAAPERYSPATESFLGGLQKTVGRAAENFHELTEAILVAVHHLDKIFDDFDGQRLPARVGTAVDGVNGAVADLSHVLRRLDRAQLPEKTAAAIVRLDGAIESLGHVLERIDGDAGLVASTQRAAEAIDQLGTSTTGATQDLDRTLRDLSDAARSVRSVADALERDPDMLFKGAAKAKSR
jgi:phospholipid/cholesterol/gamma-HCH transport system substrate-binding protein